ncbi:MAG: folate-binding protein YgfZ [Limisphaerales bacterium]|jgi:folate-binding protein YgfZ
MEIDQVYNWPEIRRILVRGPNVCDFLQGYLTCDCRLLDDQHLQPAALCNLKGRVTANGWAYLVDDTTVQLLVHASLAEAVVQALAPYAKFSRCTLDISADPILIHQIPGPLELASNWYLTNTMQDKEPLDASHPIAHQLILDGFALVTQATTDKFLPQMVGLTEIGAIDFDKGCYLGQEVVARAQFRGKVKRQLYAFDWQQTAPVVGAKSKDFGTVMSVATSIDDPTKGIGLAVI